ncbi:MAG: cation transporter [Treponema sp.]|nr:cation transporter [Candidatus Treponema caballi]
MASVVRKLSVVGIAGNIILSAFKLIAGIIGSSGAMISDAIHSLSDVLATAIAAIGVVLSRKTADKEHPYGHERFECIASLALGLILAVTGAGIGWSGIKTIMAGDYASLAIPTLLPLIAAIVSIVTKEAMFRYTMHYAKQMNSAAFVADAWHHRSDALSSIGSLAGILGARLGAPVMEPIACVVIAACIIKVAVDILRDALKKMLDTSCGTDVELELVDFIEKQEGVRRLDELRTRMFGNQIYVDVEIAADGSIPLVEAHEIAERVHDGIEEKFPAVKHVMVHVNPYE